LTQAVCWILKDKDGDFYIFVAPTLEPNTEYAQST